MARVVAQKRWAVVGAGGAVGTAEVVVVAAEVVGVGKEGAQCRR
jgi:hypothetical protein